MYFYLADLKKDILNGPYHRLGQHINCDDYFCSGTKVGEKNLVPDAEKCGMMREIKYIISRLVNNASSLIEDVTNNLCEQFNSVINKHIGGKRINFSQGRNFETRIEAAVIAYNSKKYLRTIHKKMLMTSPGKLNKNILIR